MMVLHGFLISALRKRGDPGVGVHIELALIVPLCLFQAEKKCGK